MPARFWELTIPAPPETREALTNFLWELGALGVVEEEMRGIPSPASGAPEQLRAFFPGSASPGGLERATRDYCSALSALGFEMTAVEPAVAPLEEAAWDESWRQSFTPIRVGRRLLVAPPWDIPFQSEGRRVVVIEPGRAFGTGAHGSTQGCLVLLESLLEREPATHALDLGTGTGILAIAALKLGVPRLTALDTDADAIAAAISNAERNGLSARLRCLMAGPESLDGEQYPIILANLLAESHVAGAASYRRLLMPGGALILGGILADEEDEVAGAMANQALERKGRVEIDGWVSLVMGGMSARR
ncbi:MAG: 50S ribosomal protein L11 methyltransferase [Candidatus Methylomirabilia bacterium]